MHVLQTYALIFFFSFFFSCDLMDHHIELKKLNNEALALFP